MEFFLATFGHLGRVRFIVQNYCEREKCQVPPWAFGWRAWRKPSANFLVPPKLGYSVRTLRPHACLILPCVRSGYLHVKRFTRPRSSKELHKREKYQISPILKTQGIMRTRRMTIEQGRRVGIDRFPNFHRSGTSGAWNGFTTARIACWYVVAATSTMFLSSQEFTIKQPSKTFQLCMRQIFPDTGSNANWSHRGVAIIAERLWAELQKALSCSSAAERK